MSLNRQQTSFNELSPAFRDAYMAEWSRNGIDSALFWVGC